MNLNVHDLAELHCLSILDLAAKNKRFIAVNDAGAVPILGVGRIIKERTETTAEKVSTMLLWNWPVKSRGPGV